MEAVKRINKKGEIYFVMKSNQTEKQELLNSISSVIDRCDNQDDKNEYLAFQKYLNKLEHTEYDKENEESAFISVDDFLVLQRIQTKLYSVYVKRNKYLESEYTETLAKYNTALKDYNEVLVKQKNLLTENNEILQKYSELLDKYKSLLAEKVWETKLNKQNVTVQETYAALKQIIDGLEK